MNTEQQSGARGEGSGADQEWLVLLTNSFSLYEYTTLYLFGHQLIFGLFPLSLEKCLFRSFAHFLHWVICLFIVELVARVLYILDARSLSDI